MDSQTKGPSPGTGPAPTNDMFSNKNFIIIILIALLLLSFLGVNLLTILGNGVQWINNLFGPLVSQILSVFGYTTGTILDKSADLVGETAKTGIDIATGTVRSVGGLLIDASDDNLDDRSKIDKIQPKEDDKKLDEKINTGGENKKPSSPEPSDSANPIQNSISSQKTSWCLVGEYQDKRGCIEIGEADQCLSGQVFPSQKMCLNPTLSQGPPHLLKSQATH
jgi:hypothetical protein